MYYALMANVGTMIVHNTKKVNGLTKFNFSALWNTDFLAKTKIEHYFANEMNESDFAVQWQSHQIEIKII